MVKAKWGTKRICQNCGAKYYDFNKSPIICPSCDAVFDPEAFMRRRRTRGTSSLAVTEVRPESAEVEAVKDLPVLTPVEGVDEPEPMDADQPDVTPDSDVPDDLDLGPEFDSGSSTADDDSLLDDDELADNDLPPVQARPGSKDDDNDS